MAISEFIILIISGGLGGAVVRYILDVRRAKYEYVMKLHREWWSAEFSQMRSEVYKIVEDLNAVDSGAEAGIFLKHVKSGRLLEHPTGHAFVQIVVFFAQVYENGLPIVLQYINEKCSNRSLTLIVPSCLKEKNDLVI